MKTVDPLAFGSKHEIEDNPSEPIAATDRNQARNNLANVALMDSNQIKRGDDEVRKSNLFELQSILCIAYHACFLLDYLSVITHTNFCFVLSLSLSCIFYVHSDRLIHSQV